MKTTFIKIEKANVISWKRERNTTCGNPVYSFTIADENEATFTGRTRPNAGFVYGLCSHPETLENVTIATTPSGRVYMDNADNVK